MVSEVLKETILKGLFRIPMKTKTLKMMPTSVKAAGGIMG